MNQGKLLTVEGISGMGKTYYFNKLQQEYIDDSVIFNKEITDEKHNGINSKLFDILSSNNSKFFDNGNSKLEALLICAKQVNDEKQFVIPNIFQGKTVVSDRGYDSLCILEGIIIAKEFDLSEEKCIFELYDIFKKFCLIPDKTILLIGDEDKAIKRAEKREKYNYTIEELKILKSSAYWFKEIADYYYKRFDIINVDELDEKEIVRRMKKNI